MILRIIQKLLISLLRHSYIAKDIDTVIHKPYRMWCLIVFIIVCEIVLIPITSSTSRIYSRGILLLSPGAIETLLSVFFFWNPRKRPSKFWLASVKTYICPCASWLFAHNIRFNHTFCMEFRAHDIISKRLFCIALSH